MSLSWIFSRRTFLVDSSPTLWQMKFFFWTDWQCILGPKMTYFARAKGPKMKHVARGKRSQKWIACQPVDMFFVKNDAWAVFAWEIETFGTKDKQLRISRGVINWLGVHPPIQNLPQKTICCLFSRAWHETKNRDWVFEQESRKTSFPLVCFSVNEIFRLCYGQKATSVLFVFYTRCCIRPNRSRSHGVSMNLRCDTAVSDENETCGKMLENNNF